MTSTSKSRPSLFAQQPQAVEYHQQAPSHIGEHGHPQRRMAAQGQTEENDLDAQRQSNVLLQYRGSVPAEPNEPEPK